MTDASRIHATLRGMTLALRVAGLWKGYAAGVVGCSARVWVLRGLSLELAPGERVGVVGAPGSGRTTLLLILAGVLRPDAGRFWWGGDAAVDRVGAAVHPHSAASGSSGAWAPRGGGAAPPPVALLDTRPDGSACAAVPPRAPLGGTALIVGGDVASVLPQVHRVLLLRDGRLAPLRALPARRVAERAPRAVRVG